MSPFLKVMQLFLMMSATVLGMLVLLLFIPDLEESILEAMHRYQFTNPRPPPPPSPSHHQEHASVSKNANTPEDGRSEFLSGSKMGYLMAVEIDRKKKKFTPWPSSEECRQYYIQFARQKSLPMTALVSFPGSGNTWVRYLIETTTGIFTGSVYADKLIFSKGFFGERESPDCGCTSVQKTHGFALAGAVPKLPTEKTAEVSLFNGRAILLLRNPYEALLSYRNYLYGGHTGFAPNNKFRGRDPVSRTSTTMKKCNWSLFCGLRDLPQSTKVGWSKARDTGILIFERLEVHIHKMKENLNSFRPTQRL
ncbi:unnamed protein product [Bemisia tabaci]|uniref:Uncharacterized protein n=1 Tax=Bemisia tabaci TaxID=7038 RepID=A0A9P0F6J1_BEMTA|nr:unnamed protein product [Bemisia tabaci]